MTVGFDNLAINRNLLFGLPFREGQGVITHDEAKLNRLLTQHVPGLGAFAWGNLATGIPYLEFSPIGGGATEGVYMDCPAADTGDMDFITGDYSIGGWINWGAGTNQSEIIVGRYGTELDGWDCYLNAVSSTLSHRHHHSSLGGGNLKSECFSSGWIPGSWSLFGISRLGASLYPLHYRNAVPLPMTYDANGMLDPDSCNRDLVMGARAITLANNWYWGMMANMRVWGRALTPEDWNFILHREGHWFGVN